MAMLTFYCDQRMRHRPGGQSIPQLRLSGPPAARRLQPAAPQPPLLRPQQQPRWLPVLLPLPAAARNAAPSVVPTQPALLPAPAAVLAPPTVSISRYIIWISTSPGIMHRHKAALCRLNSNPFAGQGQAQMN